VAVAGAAAAPLVAGDVRALRACYALLMLGLSARLLAGERDDPDACVYEGAREVVDSDGKIYSFDAPERDAAGQAQVAGGAFLTGLLGVGVGEVVLPSLTRDCGMPVPVAAGSSVAVVFAAAAAAAVAQFAQLADAAGGDVAAVVPWDLVAFTVPGVVLGGQIAPRLAGRLPDAVVEAAAGVLFGGVGVAFAAKAVAG
jgi:hypothetical protein